MTMITNSSSVPGDPLEISSSALYFSASCTMRSISIVDLQACKLGTGRRFTTS